ncbi:hypothetical protein CEUSTIGMA_g13343.t1 [Chlamydomonas eustigma]|uniref:Uncharacterized protein n=1 Tax=Chlamydomonas eustigma TaxID=1157962 RepID=A0A250XS64_9CHLO|nr:hypothetical protein CEUSTIGMA_g13343.t1 [Chlamydomonas eustigma]|eukprot:GAX85927.1 hypothetical protein CEUSTIGMA_g13343.t1 [Chlamydomonas eustigma]
MLEILEAYIEGRVDQNNNPVLPTDNVHNSMGARVRVNEATSVYDPCGQNINPANLPLGRGRPMDRPDDAHDKDDEEDPTTEYIMQGPDVLHHYQHANNEAGPSNQHNLVANVPPHPPANGTAAMQWRTQMRKPVYKARAGHRNLHAYIGFFSSNCCKEKPSLQECFCNRAWMDL